MQSSETLPQVDNSSKRRLLAYTSEPDISVFTFPPKTQTQTTESQVIEEYELPVSSRKKQLDTSRRSATGLPGKGISGALTARKQPLGWSNGRKEEDSHGGHNKLKERASSYQVNPVKSEADDASRSKLKAHTPSYEDKPVRSDEKPAKNKLRTRAGSFVKMYGNSTLSAEVFWRGEKPPPPENPIVAFDSLLTQLHPLLDATKFAPDQLNLMVVGRDKVTSSLAYKYLVQLGYQVAWPQSASDAIEHLKIDGEKYLLLLVPIQMEDMDGVEFLENVLTIFPNSRPPVVMMTGAAGIHSIVNVIQSGAVDCLQSPITLETVRAKVRLYLEARFIKNQIIQISNVVIKQEAEYRRLLALQPARAVIGTQTDRASKAIAIQTDPVDWTEENQQIQAQIQQQKVALEEADTTLKAALRQIEELKGEVASLQQENKEVKQAKDSLLWRTSWLENENNKIGDSAKTKEMQLLLKERELEQIEKDIQNMKKQAQDWESPVQSLLRDVSNVQLNPVQIDAKQLRSIIAGFLDMLSNNSPWTPALDKIFKSMELDDMTKRWMEDQFGNFRKKQVNVKQRKTGLLLRLDSIGVATPRGEGNSTPGRVRQSMLRVTTERHRFLEVIAGLEMDVWNYSEDELVGVVYAMFEDLGLVEKFKIAAPTLDSFLRALLRGYESTNPYHNHYHAVDVTQTVYWLVKKMHLTSTFTKLEMLSLIVAAIAHDVQHPGLNNAYQVSARTQLARLYNDRSVLENYHSFRVFEILQEEECNILAGLSDIEYRDLRKIVIAAILGTDMAVHFELVSKLSTHLTTKGPQTSEPDDRLLLMTYILHAADISNVCKPLEISKRWSNFVFEEFLNQGDLEREKGFNVSPYMDRSNTDQVKMTINFIDYICLPVFSNLKQFHEGSAQLLTNLQSNRAHWEGLQKKGEALPVPKPTGKLSGFREQLLCNPLSDLLNQPPSVPATPPLTHGAVVVPLPLQALEREPVKKRPLSSQPIVSPKRYGLPTILDLSASLGTLK